MIVINITILFLTLNETFSLSDIIIIRIANVNKYNVKIQS